MKSDWPKMVERLTALRDALAERGIQSEVDEHAMWPRLRLYPPMDDHRASAEFDNSIIVMSVIWFSFAWAEVIGRVEDPEESAARLVAILNERTGFLA